MKNIISFIDQLKSIINNHETNFIKRRNTNPENKLSLTTTLYSCALTLNNSGISSVISDLLLDNITDVSKNALIKKRNNDITWKCIKNINDDIIDMIYNKDNQFIKPFNFRIDKDNKSYIRNNTNKVDKSLYINRSGKRFVGCDGVQITVIPRLIYTIVD